MSDLEELKGLEHKLKKGVHFHQSDIPTLSWAITIIEQAQQVVGLLKADCNKLAADLEYKTSRVSEQDIKIQKLREQVATLADPASLAQALSLFTAQQAESVK